MAMDTWSLLGASNYAATREQVAMARRWVRETVEGLVNDESRYDLSLCADELADNARKHGRTDGVISLRLYVDAETVRLEVANDSLGITVPCVTENLLTEEGHGLKIVEAVAARWGSYGAGDHDQVVWCEFPRIEGKSDDTAR
jgi:two-component sensor histidine kinase